jgi:hypothetical protein
MPAVQGGLESAQAGDGLTMRPWLTLKSLHFFISIKTVIFSALSMFYEII